MDSTTQRLMTSAGGPIDPFFENVTMLLHGDGTNGAQNNTFLDSSSNNSTITRNGNTTQGSLNPFGDRWSNYFDGTGDYLTVSGGMPSGAGTAFTMECWIYLDNISNYRVITRGDSSSRFDWGVTSSGALSLDNSGVVNICASANGSIKANTWHHVAVTRSTGNVYKLWIDGVNAATSAAYTTSMTANTTIGYSSFSGSHYFIGYISNFRVVNSEVYTAAFTPPTVPLTAITNTSLLTCQSNRFIDNSSNNFAITRNGDVSVRPFSPFAPSAAYSTSANGGSGYFDGTGDYLSLTNASALQLANSGAFTIEFWVNPDSIGTNRYIFTNYNQSSPYQGYGFGIGCNLLNSEFQFWDGGSWRSFGLLTANVWTHVAISYEGSGTTGRVFLNGTQAGSSFTINSGINYTAGTAVVGTQTASTGFFTGYISNLRIVKGTAVYTANFTPPAAPLTAITNTSLLLNFTNAGIIDNAADNVLETVGNAQISTSVKKYGTGSLAFDGTGDYLQLLPSVGLEMGGGDFTWEFWIYPNSVASSAHILAQQAQDTTIQFDNGAGNILIVWDGANRAIGSVSTSQWTHVALVRSSGTLKVYLNGVATGSSWTNTSSTRFTLSSGLVGSRWGNTNNFNGYIDDLRITKGVARYTANFTPPSGPFPDM